MIQKNNTNERTKKQIKSNTIVCFIFLIILMICVVLSIHIFTKIANIKSKSKYIFEDKYFKKCAPENLTYNFMTMMMIIIIITDIII